MALSGNTWVQDVEPTTGVVACQQWIKPTTGEMYYRDTTNTVWTPFGNINNNLGGAVMVSGDTMTGPLLDAPEKARRQNLVVAATSIVGAWSIPKECANVGMNRHTASFNTRSNILHNLTP